MNARAKLSQAFVLVSLLLFGPVGCHDSFSFFFDCGDRRLVAPGEYRARFDEQHRRRFLVCERI